MVCDDIGYMEMAIELAKRGEGLTNPNPLVGAVIVKDGKVIGKGYHEQYGLNHAEINAFESAESNVKGATMYVTLEPCSHYGKTPPCAKAIVEKGIKKVVIAMKDPNPIVSGKGIKILKDGGIDVEVGILKERVEKINEIFIKYITTSMPFIILKTAMTLDGKIATASGDSKWISCEESRKFVHKIRNRVSGILVGVNTIINDNPRLNTRLNSVKCRNPIRIILDSTGRIPLEAEVLNTNTDSKTIIALSERASLERINAIKGKGADVIIAPEKNGKVDIVYLMKKLGSMKIDSILLEGGSEVNFSFISEGLVDKIISFISPKLIGGRNAKTPIGGDGIEFIRDAVNLNNVEVSAIGKDIMVEGYLNN